ncbi:ABC transporter permease [Paenarthrobacter nitroguajacolicus]
MTLTPHRSAAHPASRGTNTVRTASPATRYKLGNGAGTLLAIPLSFLAIALVVPVVFMLWTAFFSPGDATIASVISDPLFGRALGLTVGMAAIVSAFCVVLGTVYALGILLAPKPLKILLIGAIASTFVVSLMVRTYGWVILMQPKGIIYDLLVSLRLTDGPLQILQTAPAMYIGMIHVMVPYSILLTYTALAALDTNQLKASRSMGASAQLTFWRVILPQISPGVVAGGLLVFLISLGFYITPAVLGGPSQLTMGTLIGREMRVFDFKSASLMGALLFVAVLILYLLAERIFKITDQWDRT